MKINESENNKLLRFFNESQGHFALGFACSDDIYFSDNTLVALSCALKENGVRLEKLNFEIENIDDLFSMLHDRDIKLNDSKTPSIVLYGLEKTIKNNFQGKNNFLQKLNLDRDRFRRGFQTPILFWLKPDSYKAIQEKAPDFFDYRCASFDFIKKKIKKIASPKKTYKVYVASAYLDNIEKRKYVSDAISMAGMVWHGLELHLSSTKPTVKECLRMAKEADLLIGIIGWRYGWVPDNEKSIIEMEYGVAKERLMFLIDPNIPINPEKDFDPQPDRWEKQKKLETFKNRILKKQFCSIFNETTLNGKLLHALNLWRERLEDPSTKKIDTKLAKTTIQITKPDKVILDYCKKLEFLNSSIPVAGFVTQLRVPIDIEDIYVPLRAMPDLRGIREGSFSDASNAEKCLSAYENSIDISLLEAFSQAKSRNQRGVVILGDPGSGKTTHLKRLLLWNLRNGPESIGLPKETIPVFLPLRELHDLEKGIDGFIQQQLSDPLFDKPPYFGKELLKRGNLLLLFDGLDEVSDLKQREKIAKWIINALKFRPDCWFVVTCRFSGYDNLVRLSEAFLEVHIRPFNKDQAERFISNWYKIAEKGLARDPDQAEGIAMEKANHLIKTLQLPDFRSNRVLELTRNPLLLANICLVHRHRGTLPKKRVRLYEECLDVMLEHWREAKGLKVSISSHEGRRALQPMALWLHKKKDAQKPTPKNLSLT